MHHHLHDCVRSNKILWLSCDCLLYSQQHVPQLNNIPLGKCDSQPEGHLDSATFRHIILRIAGVKQLPQTSAAYWEKLADKQLTSIRQSQICQP